MPVVLTLILAAAVPSTVASQSPVPPAAQKPQILFNEASAAAENDCPKAVGLFETLEQQKVLKEGSLGNAATAVRKGICLIRLDRTAEGGASIRRGLPVLEKAGPDFSEDVIAAWVALGDGAMDYHDYETAQGHYRHALAAGTGLQKLGPLVRLAKASAFDGDAASLGYSEQGIALLSAVPEKERGKVGKDSLAAFYTLHGRTLLNQGRADEGYADLKKALTLSGGLTTRTSLSEVSMRADLGMAAALVGRKEDARLYLAYTGAGRLDGARFGRGVSMEPPLCGTETGLRPDDVAVVEFSIGDDGQVSNARTVYSRGNRTVAAAFAKAVDDWYWDPASIKDIPLFYRVATRLEVRCSTAGGDGPSILSPLREHVGKWFASVLPQQAEMGSSTAQWVVTLRQRLASPAFDGKPLARVAALSLIAEWEAGPDETRIANANAALAAATEAKAPLEVINWLRLMVLGAGSGSSPDGKMRTALRSLAADPAFAGDALAADTALMLSTVRYRGRTGAEEPAILQQVADDRRLFDHHPLRQAARLSLANLAAASGDTAAAQLYFAATGLSEQQCALIGVRPAMRSSGADSSDYPMEAIRMGFEGWVQLEFDVTADGRAAAARPIVAYPPLIFVDAATGMAKGFRYEASYRPGGGNACSANHQTISFARPNG